MVGFLKIGPANWVSLTVFFPEETPSLQTYELTLDGYTVKKKVIKNLFEGPNFQVKRGSKKV